LDGVNFSLLDLRVQQSTRQRRFGCRCGCRCGCRRFFLLLGLWRGKALQRSQLRQQRRILSAQPLQLHHRIRIIFVTLAIEKC
jgi:hypothetical protein